MSTSHRENPVQKDGRGAAGQGSTRHGTGDPAPTHRIQATSRRPTTWSVTSKEMRQAVGWNGGFPSVFDGGLVPLMRSHLRERCDIGPSSSSF